MLTSPFSVKTGAAEVIRPSSRSRSQRVTMPARAPRRGCPAAAGRDDGAVREDVADPEEHQVAVPASAAAISRPNGSRSRGTAPRACGCASRADSGRCRSRRSGRRRRRPDQQLGAVDADALQARHVRARACPARSSPRRRRRRAASSCVIAIACTAGGVNGWPRKWLGVDRFAAPCSRPASSRQPRAAMKVSPAPGATGSRRRS